MSAERKDQAAAGTDDQPLTEQPEPAAEPVERKDAEVLLVGIEVSLED